jgi:hypothetical protein
LVAFAETAEGVQWLRRQVVAIHFVITLLAGAGVRRVCEYLELSGLSALMASSYGARQPFNVALEEAVVASGERQRAEKLLLATLPPMPNQPPKRDALCPASRLRSSGGSSFSIMLAL